MNITINELIDAPVALRHDRPANPAKARKWGQAFDLFCSKIQRLSSAIEEGTSTPSGELLLKLHRRIDIISHKLSRPEDREKITQVKERLESASAFEMWYPEIDPDRPDISPIPILRPKSGPFSLLLFLQAHFFGLTCSVNSQRKQMPHNSSLALDVYPSEPICDFGVVETLREATRDLQHPPAFQQPQCFPLPTLETNLQLAMADARTQFASANEGCGNKHRNLIKMADLVDALPPSDLAIPRPHGVPSHLILRFIELAAPKVFEHWKYLQSVHESPESQTAPARFLFSETIKQIDTALSEAFSQATYTQLGLSLELQTWLQSMHKSRHYLMVRSTGAEDSHTLANAGGNVSRAYVPPTEQEVCQAIGDVVRSYFSLSSLQNRILANTNPFKEDLNLAVTLQQVIGEPIGGAEDPTQIPVSFVLFTNEPLYIGNEKFRAMRISSTYGHGEAVVGSKGIATDSYLLLHSESQPDELYLLSDIQPKPQRLSPILNEGKPSLEPVANPPELVARASLSEKQLLSLYRSGVLMEAYFDNHPTDIEGVVKGDTVYFVQARPVNRPAMLPTYLDISGIDQAVLQQQSSDVLVPGKGSVITIADRKEILLAPTLEEAERLYRPDLHKLIIVSYPEPANSHPVVNFSGLGVPCLYLAGNSNLLFNQITPSRPLAVCMQSGTLNLWNADLEPLEQHIVPGFAIHPAKISVALPVPPNTIKTGTAAPEDLKEQFWAFQTATTAQEALRLLNQLEKHPYLQNLRQTLRQPSPSVSSWELLQTLEKKISRGFAELRAQLTKPQTDSRLKQLLHAKILHTLFFSAPGRFALTDTPAVIEAIHNLSAYQKTLSHPAHCAELLLVQTPMEPQWRQFLLNLEPLIEKGIVSQEELSALKTALGSIKQTGALPLWMTFYQPKQNSSAKEKIREILQEFTPKTLEKLNLFSQKQQEIQNIRNQLGRFADPDTFESAWNELLPLIQEWSRVDLSGLSPITRISAYRTMDILLDTLDLAGKALQSSHQYTNSAQKTARFKQMLTAFFPMVQHWAIHLIPEKTLSTHVDWPIPLYFEQIEIILNGLSNTNPDGLLPDSSFSVAAAMIGTGTAFSRHLPRNLASVWTLLHQNGLSEIAALNQALLPQQKIEESLLPPEFKQGIQLVQELVQEPNIVTTKQIGIEVTEEGYVVRFNVPLRNHSGQLELHYNRKNGHLALKGHLLGQARERWPQIVLWAKVIEKGFFKPIRPLLQTANEFTFLWEVTPETLPIALEEYRAMAIESMFNNPILYRHLHRLLDHPDVSSEFMDAIFEVNKEAALSTNTFAFVEDPVSNSFNIFKFLIEKNHRPTITELPSILNQKIALLAGSVEQLGDRITLRLAGSLEPLRDLLILCNSKDLYIQYALELGDQLNKQGNPLFLSSLLIPLIDRGIGIAEAQKLMQSPTFTILGVNLELCLSMIEMGAGLEESKELFSRFITDPKADIRNAAFKLLQALFRKGQIFQEDREKMELITKEDRPTQALTDLLLEKGWGPQLVIQAMENLTSQENEPRETGLQLLLYLIEKNHEIEKIQDQIIQKFSSIDNSYLSKLATALSKKENGLNPFLDLIQNLSPDLVSIDLATQNAFTILSLASPEKALNILMNMPGKAVESNLNRVIELISFLIDQGVSFEKYIQILQEKQTSPTFVPTSLDLIFCAKLAGTHLTLESAQKAFIKTIFHESEYIRGNSYLLFYSLKQKGVNFNIHYSPEPQNIKESAWEARYLGKKLLAQGIGGEEVLEMYERVKLNSDLFAIQNAKEFIEYWAMLLLNLLEEGKHTETTIQYLKKLAEIPFLKVRISQSLQNFV